MPNSDVPLDDYSRALDEIYRLRTALAIEARAVQVHLDFKTFPKSQRKYAERQIERMRAAARGGVEQAYDVELSGWRGKTCLREAGASETLTRHQWEQESPVTRPKAVEVVHGIADGSVAVWCCGKTPFELPAAAHRLTQDAGQVTCPGRTATAPYAGQAEPAPMPVWPAPEGPEPAPMPVWPGDDVDPVPMPVWPKPDEQGGER